MGLHPGLGWVLYLFRTAGSQGDLLEGNLARLNLGLVSQFDKAALA